MHFDEKLQALTSQYSHEIKISLVKADLSQAELARQINENTAQVCQAINGCPGERFVRIRKKISQKLGIRP